MIEGQFVVLEGIDGAGTTTHTKLLADSLRGRGLPIRTTREPSDGPIGVMLRQFLSGRLIVPGVNGPRDPSWAQMALLFAADRLDHLDATVVPNLLDGVTVLSDRYVPSSLAYQSLTSPDPDALSWVQALNAKARIPDLTIVLDIPVSVSFARMAQRSAGRDIYDDRDLQEKLGEFYQQIDRHLPGHRIVHIDSNRAQDLVARDILSTVIKLREGQL